MFSVGNIPNDNLTPVVLLADTEIDLFEKEECESSQEIDVNLGVAIIDVETIFSTNHVETDEITLSPHTYILLCSDFKPHNIGGY